MYHMCQTVYSTKRKIMKTSKLILSIALVILTTTGFTQLSNIKERLLHKHHQKVVYLTADSNNNKDQIENWMFDLQSWASNITQRDPYVAPVVTKTIIARQADIVYENDIRIESWMTAPFETSLVEGIQFLETWMTAPFEAAEKY